MNSPKPRRLARLLGVSEVLMKGEKDENGNWPKRRIVGFTLRCGGKRSPVHDKRNWDQYYVIKKLRIKKSKKGVKYKKKKISINQIKVLPITWKHGLKLQGFPGRANLPAGVSSAQMMKQLGNSVAVPAIKAWGEKIAKAITKS
jgi:DNA (cytosine-5)-methyltransferase 1